MRKKLPKILVTGGAGFIGSEFVRQLLNGDCLRSGLSPFKVVVVDKLTYAADLGRLTGVKGKFKFYREDICNFNKLEKIFEKEQPQIVAHFAAETHVDRSIIDSSPFIETNIKGTKEILDLVRKYGIKKLIHISTDEVYGDIRTGRFHECSPIRPNSPYAASKAAADLLIGAYIRTYGLPAIIVRPSNNYGPWQYPEKLIPLITIRALKNNKVPVYAKGENIREWLYVSDCARAILVILKKGKIGEVYNVGSSDERKNIDVVKGILKILGKPFGLIEFVADRPGHDFRYALDTAKIYKLGWRPKIKFSVGLERTVNWLAHNKEWVKRHCGKKLSISFK